MTELVLTFLSLLAMAILVGVVLDRRRPPAFQQHVQAMTAAFEDFRVAIGEQLLPVMQQTTTAFQQFAEALRKESE